jgi:hypothetical protein
MRKRTKILIGLLATILLLVIAAIFFWRRSLPDSAMSPLPVPNGYADLVQGGSMVQNSSLDFAKMSQTELRESVAANSNALQMARAGLGKKIQVPVQFSTAYAGNHLTDLAGLKETAGAFLAESRLAETEKRPHDGANSCLDATRMGIESQRGGLLIDALVGIAIESMATAQLEHFVDSLDAKSCRDIAKTLEDLDAQRQPWEEIISHENYWSRKTFTGLNYTIARIFTAGQTRAMETKGKQKFITQEIKTRTVIIELASRAYELENGHRPNSPNDLVPGYLKAVPEVSGTGTNVTHLP